jgi:hypothetical protein
MGKMNPFARRLEKNKPCGTKQNAAGSDTWSLMNSWLLVSLVAATLWPVNSFADEKQAATFGDIICNLHSNAGALPYVFNAFCYIIGIFLILNGILLYKKHAEGGESKILPATARTLAGGFAISLPTAASIFQASVVGSVTGGANLTCAAPQVNTPASSSLDVILSNLVQNIHNPMAIFLSGISICVGLFLIARGLLAAAKIGTDPRAAAPKTIIVNFVIGAIMVSIGQMLPVSLQSIFGSSTISQMSTFQGINWSKITNSSTDFSKVNTAIDAVLSFVQVIGLISFVRGWMILKTAIEGNGQATIPQGATHIIGGAMAINIDKMLTIFDKTFGTCMISGNC